MTQDQFTVDAIGEDDLRDAGSVASSAFGATPQDYVDLIRYWTTGNPAWTEGIPRGWLARSASGEPVAFTANIPFAYVVEGTERLCLATGTTCVSERWRGRGLGTLVGSAFVGQEAGSLLIGTGSTEVAYGLWLSLGMRPLDRPWLRRCCRVVGDPHAWSRRRLVRFPALAAVGGLVIGPAHKLLKAAASGTGKGIAVERVTAPEQLRCDRIADLKPVEGCRTYALRDRRSLGWIYLGSPHARSSRVLLAARVNGAIVGYMGLRVRGNALSMLECRCRDDDPDIARSLIRSARDIAESMGLHYLAVWRSSPMLADCFPMADCLYAAKAGPPSYCYASRAPDLDVAAWAAEPGDGDLSVN